MQEPIRPFADEVAMYHALVRVAQRIHATHARDHPTHDGPAISRVTDSDANVDVLVILGDRTDWRETLRELDRAELLVVARWRDRFDRAPVLKETHL